MNNSMKFLTGFCLMACLFLFSTSAFAQNGNGGNGNGATPTANGVILPAQNNGQGFQNGQGHQNGNSNISLGCSAQMYQALNNYHGGFSNCVYGQTENTLTFYQITSNHFRTVTMNFNANTCTPIGWRTDFICNWSSPQVQALIDAGDDCGAVNLLMQIYGL